MKLFFEKPFKGAGECLRKTVVIFAIFNFGAVTSAFSNSRAFAPIEREDLPKSVSAFAAWKGWLPRELQYTIDREQVDRFLTHGEWTRSFPSNSKAMTFVVEGKEIRAFITGAFSDEKGRIFNWWLRSPRVLELEGGGKCYLRLPDDEKTALIPFPAPEGEEKNLPAIGKNLSVVDSKWPATGTFKTLPESALIWFVENGKPVAPFPEFGKNSTGTRKLRSKIVQRNSSAFGGVSFDSKWLKGVRVPEHSVGWKPRVEGVFLDRDRSLWLARLHSESLMEVDNGRGRKLFLQDPATPAPLKREIPNEKAAGITDLQITNLNLHGTWTDDEGLAQLRKLKKLRTLNLAITAISDEGLSHLEGHGELKWLTLSYTGISDRGLKHLHGMANLFDVQVIGTEVTEKGARELFATLPNCKRILGQWNGKLVQITGEGN